jgi:hypothetical protein
MINRNSCYIDSTLSIVLKVLVHGPDFSLFIDNICLVINNLLLVCVHMHINVYIYIYTHIQIYKVKISLFIHSLRMNIWFYLFYIIISAFMNICTQIFKAAFLFFRYIPRSAMSGWYSYCTNNIWRLYMIFHKDYNILHYN